jgi:peptidoglycan/LPS O-acetylase OafA/YrhL
VLQLFRVDLARFAPWIGIVFIAAVLAISLLLNRLFDEPARKWLAKKWKARIVREPVTQAP